jgi:hypothetical protein
VQIAPDGRQRDVHHGDVEPDDEEAHAADEQDADPAPAAGRVEDVRGLARGLLFGIIITNHND